MNSRQAQYWEKIRPQLPRFFSLLDHRPFSKTYGSFDRKYWHYRTIDFSSAAMQQGVETLAHLFQWNHTHGLGLDGDSLLSWSEAGLRFTADLQYRDGSFDEWYVNERGWAGPTAYVLNSLFTAYQILGQQWSNESREIFREVFLKGSKHLLNFEEGHVLSNHQALALVCLQQAQELFREDWLAVGYEDLKRRFLRCWQAEEGWTVEYDGADPGYQTATLSFLARLYQLRPDPEILQTVASQLNFLKHFYFPDGSYARGLGSRSTSVVFLFGFEYWAQFFPMARRMAQDLLRSMVKGRILDADQMDDHYFVYRLPELLMAMGQADEANSSDLPKYPFEDSARVKSFEKAGMLAIKNGHHYAVVNWRWGGRAVFYDLRNHRLKQVGDLFANHRTRILSSATGNGQWRQLNSGQWLCSAPFGVFHSPVFTPFKFWLFRWVSFFMGQARWARLFKNGIRRWLMEQQGEHGPMTLNRTFDFQSMQVKTEIQSPVGEVFEVVGCPSRHVPQSNYWSSNSP